MNIFGVMRHAVCCFEKTRFCCLLHTCCLTDYDVFLFYVSDGKEYALKLIEGTGISMSACREIAVSVITQKCSNFAEYLTCNNRVSFLFLNVLQAPDLLAIAA